MYLKINKNQRDQKKEEKKKCRKINFLQNKKKKKNSKIDSQKNIKIYIILSLIRSFTHTIKNLSCIICI